MVQGVKVAAVAPRQGGRVQGEVSPHLIKSKLVPYSSSITHFTQILTLRHLLVQLEGDTKEAAGSNASRSLEERAASKRCHAASSLEMLGGFKLT